jgi:hypothetical protein
VYLDCVHCFKISFWCSGTDFTVGKKLQLPTFRDSLKERGTVQMLTVSREVALEVQVGCVSSVKRMFNTKNIHLLLA